MDVGQLLKVRRRVFWKHSTWRITCRPVFTLALDEQRFFCKKKNRRKLGMWSMADPERGLWGRRNFKKVPQFLKSNQVSLAYGLTSCCRLLTDCIELWILFAADTDWACLPAFINVLQPPVCGLQLHEIVSHYMISNWCFSSYSAVKIKYLYFAEI